MSHEHDHVSEEGVVEGRRRTRSWFFGRKEEHAFTNPHAEPAKTTDLQRSLSFLLAHLAHKGKLMDEAYTMLLGSAEDRKRGLDLIARQIAARRLGRQEEEDGGPQLELDLHSGLHIALLECEKESAPVSAVSLQSVEDDKYEGYTERRIRRGRLVRFTVIAFVLGIIFDAASSGLMVKEEARLRSDRSFEAVAEMTRRQIPVLEGERSRLMAELKEPPVACAADETNQACKKREEDLRKERKDELKRIDRSMAKLMHGVLLSAGEKRRRLLELKEQRGVTCEGQDTAPVCDELEALKREFMELVAPHLSDVNLAALDDIDAQESLSRMLTYLVRSFALFLWGIVGGGFFMLRRLYDFVEKRIYDPAMKGMHLVSLLIGGLAGTLVPLTIFPQLLGLADPLAIADPSLMLTASGVAVIAGFGSKLIYGLFEKLIEGLQVVIGLRTSQG